MFISSCFSADEYTALLAAMERSGFSSVEAFAYWATMQRVYALLDELNVTQ